MLPSPLARHALGRCSIALALAALSWLSASPSLAAGPLGPQGSPIATSRYSLDLFEGPVLSSSRVTSLSGAYAAMAEGVDAMVVCAAAPAVREPWSFSDVDYDLSLGFTSPTTLGSTDFDNNGSPGFTYRSFEFVTLGGQLQFGAWGVGVLLDGQTYRLGHAVSATDARQLEVELSRAHVQLARRFLDGQLSVGVGIRGATLALAAAQVDRNDTQELGRVTGSGVEAGLLLAPTDLPLRASFTARSEVGGDAQVQGDVERSSDGDLTLGGLHLPSKVKLPWELEAGLAWQLGPRPLNQSWLSPSQLDEASVERERIEAPGESEASLRRRALRRRYEAVPRQKLLLLASLLVSGPVSDGVGVESFLSQRVDRSGRRAVLTPRLGVEAEPLPGWLKARAGGYLEPSRYDEGSARLHGTLGLEAKVLPWTVFGLFDQGTWWRASGFVDAARRYSSWGVSVGIWH